MLFDLLSPCIIRESSSEQVKLLGEQHEPV